MSLMDTFLRDEILIGWSNLVRVKKKTIKDTILQKKQ